MDEFIRCPQCDDDLPGGDWEQHLGTHGYFKHPDAAVPKEKSISATHLSCGCDWGGKYWTYCAQHEHEEAGEGAQQRRRRAGEFAQPRQKRRCGCGPDEAHLAPPTDTAQPVAWRYRFKRLSGKWGPKENWLYLTDDPEKNDLWEVQPLYAHPEDAPPLCKTCGQTIKAQCGDCLLSGIRKRIHKVAVDALRVTLNDHGPITRNEIGSAAKRVSSRICAQIKQNNEQVEDAPRGPYIVRRLTPQAPIWDVIDWRTNATEFRGTERQAIAVCDALNREVRDRLKGDVTDGLQ